jgi:ATP-dependent exoDNAse (exonuclease V) beta subunit
VRACRAEARGSCRREAPITLLDDDGTLLEGHVDLAFEENGEWHVIDFKTDREIGGALDRYRLQVALYVEAVARATGRPAHGLLVQI